jgi:hypothetical protein
MLLFVTTSLFSDDFADKWTARSSYTKDVPGRYLKSVHFNKVKESLTIRFRIYKKGKYQIRYQRGNDNTEYNKRKMSLIKTIKTHTSSPIEVQEVTIPYSNVRYIRIGDWLYDMKEKESFFSKEATLKGLALLLALAAASQSL